MKTLKYLVLILLLVFSSACGKDNLIDCRAGEIVLVNHRIFTITIEDINGHPLIQVPGLANWKINRATAIVDGVTYYKEPCNNNNCNCEVINIY